MPLLIENSKSLISIFPLSPSELAVVGCSWLGADHLFHLLSNYPVATVVVAIRCQWSHYKAVSDSNRTDEGQAQHDIVVPRNDPDPLLLDENIPSSQGQQWPVGTWIDFFEVTCSLYFLCSLLHGYPKGLASDSLFAVACIALFSSLNEKLLIVN